MNQTENTEVLAGAEAVAGLGEGISEAAVPAHNGSADTVGVDDELLAEAEGVRAVYPHFDLTAELSHPVLGAILRGEVKPTLRQLYEAVHLDEILESRVASGVQAQVDEAVTSAVSEAVSAAVAEAVRETEERLLSHIRARGQRPSEVGTVGGGGIRMHPAVNRLTRKERAMLAKRAENGETIQF